MYYLKAIISQKINFNHNLMNYYKYIVDLNYDFAMLPLTDKFIKKIDDIEFWVKDMSVNTIIAFIDAEYFMGVGGTKIHIYENKILVKEIYDSGDSIYDDTAVFSMFEYFEFKKNEHPTILSLGLLKHNKTEDWLRKPLFKTILQRFFPIHNPEQVIHEKDNDDEDSEQENR